ncbi:hypothetical protein Cf24236_1959 [Citrobacter farmeri]|nr:hypothetical protein Cf24236_1959 [Citrobacter farmeri]
MVIKICVVCFFIWSTIFASILCSTLFCGRSWPFLMLFTSCFIESVPLTKIDKS